MSFLSGPANALPPGATLRRNGPSLIAPPCLLHHPVYCNICLNRPLLFVAPPCLLHHPFKPFTEMRGHLQRILVLRPWVRHQGEQKETKKRRKTDELYTKERQKCFGHRFYSSSVRAVVYSGDVFFFIVGATCGGFFKPDLVRDNPIDSSRRQGNRPRLVFLTVRVPFDATN